LIHSGDIGFLKQVVVERRRSDGIEQSASLSEWLSRYAYARHCHLDALN